MLSTQDVAFSVMLTLHKTVSEFYEYFTFETVVLRSNTMSGFRDEMLLHI
jgi:hypothetical protein